MSRGPEEVNKLTESTYKELAYHGTVVCINTTCLTRQAKGGAKNVMEQFNPGLRNLINLGKNYEKAVNGMVLAGRAYYDGIAKIGDTAIASPVSKELGHVLIEISIAQKKLNDRLEENFKKFHKEIISELEKKTELDVKYMNATLKRYQTEHRSKLDSLEKSQAELKKIRRKSQGGRNAFKYEHKESECSEILNSKLPGWLETCSDATRVPENIMNMIEEIKMPGSVSLSGTPLPSPMIERNNLVRDVGRKVNLVAPSVQLRHLYDSSLLRSTSVSTGLNIIKRQKVKTIFPHTAGNNKTLLSFAQGDIITLLVSEERDGWLYGEHDITKVKGWFPSSYTKLFEGPSEETLRIPVPSPAPVRSVSSVNLTDRNNPILPPPDYVISGPTKPASEPKLETSKTTAAEGESTSLWRKSICNRQTPTDSHERQISANPSMSGTEKP
ncbi:hypothetical protein Chor_015263 [Crotalus horridus]